MYSVAGVSPYVFAGNQSDTLKVVCTDSNINQFLILVSDGIVIKP